MKPKINLTMLKCLRCGHEWHPRNTKPPKFCPNCNSPYWDKERRITMIASTPGYSCNRGESVFEATHRLYGQAATVDSTGTLPNEHPDFEFLGTVTVRPHETYNVYQIPRDVNPSLYDDA